MAESTCSCCTPKQSDKAGNVKKDQTKASSKK